MKAARAALKRELVQRDLLAESYLRNIETMDLEGLIASVEDLGTRTRRDPDLQTIYKEEYFLNTQKNIEAIVKNFYKIANPTHKENVRAGKLLELKKEVDRLLPSFNGRDFRKTVDHLKTIQRYSDRLLSYHVIDEDTYKRALESLFMKYLRKEGHTDKVKKLMDPYFVTKYKRPAYNDKLDEISALDADEGAERAAVDKLRAEINDRWKPYNDLEAQFNSFCQGLRGQFDLEKDQEAAETFDAQLETYNEDIAHKVNRMSEILTFKGNNTDWLTYWKKSYDNLSGAVEGVTRQRDHLLTQSKAVFKTKDSAAALNSWAEKLRDTSESIVESVKDMEAEIETHLQNITAIRNKRDKITSEIEKLPKEKGE
jgi:hypothetical protein